MNINVLSTTRELEDLRAILEAAPRLAYDTETSHLDWWRGRVFLLIFTMADTVWLIYVDDFPPELLRDFLTRVLTNHPEHTLEGHNIKFDRLHTASTFNVWINRQCDDTLLMAHLCDENRKNGLKPLSEDLLGMPATEEAAVHQWLEDNFSKQADWDFSKVPRELMTPYAAGDGIRTWRVRDKLWPVIQEHFSALYEQDRKVLDILTRMEWKGLKIDIPYLQKLQPDYEAVIDTLKKKAYGIVGFEFNPASELEMIELLYHKLGLTCQKFTPKGQPSVDAEALNLLDHPVIEPLLDCSEKLHLLNNFIIPLQELADVNHRVHGTFSLTRTRTGRFACSHPNLQNMPKDNDIRRAFLADENETMWFFDQSQVEMWGFAFYSKDEKMTNALRNGVDLHAVTASETLDIPISEISKMQRAMGKGTNFAIIFGVGKAKLSRYINGYMPKGSKLNDQQAFEFKQKYFIKFPAIKDFQYSVMNAVRSTRAPWGHFVKNKFGRIRRINPDKAYTGVNHLIQGLAADMMKAAMIRIDEKFPGTDFKQNIHDALRLDTKEVDFKKQCEWAKEIGNCLTDWKELSDMPMGVTYEYSNTNWAEIKTM